MALWKVKFFGAKARKEQIVQVKMVVEAGAKERVEEVLRNRYGYKVINGLKIHEYEDFLGKPY